jgi:glycosyltransferase involved in cell wall biosynthesis
VGISDDVSVRSLFEGFRLPLLEAMACGIPVIAANSGVMLEIIATVGMMVDPTQPQDITAAIHKVVTDDGLRRRLF